MKKRIAIFVLLYPVIVSILIGMGYFPMAIWLETGNFYLDPQGLKISLIALVFVFVVTAVPSLLTALLDRFLEKKEFFLRPLWMAVVGAAWAYPMASYLLPIPQKIWVWWVPVMYLTMGAVPAAICSWLSGRTTRSEP